MRISWLQFLRAAAAILVLSGHTIGMANRLGGHERLQLPTGIGVDLFFAISGFIMVFASDRLFTRPGAGGEFLIRRASRVVPLYWMATTAFLCLMLLGSRGWVGLPPLSYIATSYLFIPNDAYGSVEGIAFPLLSLGWTLSYEMLFYAVFSAFLFLPRIKAVRCVAGAMIMMVLLGGIIEPSSIVLATWCQPIIIEFVLGMLIGNAFLEGARLPRIMSVVLLTAAVAWVLLDPIHLSVLSQTPNDFRRLIGWGLPAAMTLASLILTAWKMPSMLERPALLLGDASYSLYLTHPFVLVSIEHGWPWLFGARYLAAMVLTSLILAIVFAVAVHHFIERPCDQAVKRVRARTRAPRLALEA